MNVKGNLENIQGQKNKYKNLKAKNYQLKNTRSY